MSQHHLTVLDATGSTNKLVAGWDWPLQQFFLAISDVRLANYEFGDELPAELEGAINYDSQNTLAGIQGFRHISDVEDTLLELGIPFIPSDENGTCINPKLLELLGELLNEQDGPRPKLDQKIKYWDNEPDPEPLSSEILANAELVLEWDRQFNYRYTHQDPHPTYSNQNYKRWCEEVDVFFIVPYENWVRQQLVEVARVYLGVDASQKS